MKQTVAVKKEGLAVAGKKPAPPAQARAPQATSNHLLLEQAISGDWEQQADGAAERVLAGAVGVGRLLRPAPAAGFRLTASRGLPLPREVREQFERGFGADLSAVRIHYDEPAQAAAKTERARAFTSGRDIFLSNGAAGLASTSGRRLLAHEVAHALQQTGAAATQDFLQATDTQGAGPVQRKPIEEVYADMNLFVEPMDISAILKRYKTQYPDLDDLKIAMQFVEGMIDKTGDEIAAAIDAKRKEPDWKDTLEKKAFFYDVLKTAGKHHEALKLVGHKIPETTAFGLSSFYIEHLRGDLSWISDYAKYHPELGKFWKKRFVNTFVSYFYGLARPVQNLGTHGKFEEWANDETKKAAAAEGTIANEKYFFALAALYQVDGFRKKMVKYLETLNPEGVDEDLIMRKYKVANLMTKAENLVELVAMYNAGGPGDLSQEAMALYEDVIPDLQEAAEAAAAYWVKIVEFEKAYQESKTYEGFAPKEVVEKIPERKEFKGLEEKLQKLVRKLFVLAPFFKSPEAYAGLMEEQAKSFAAIFNKYDQALIEMKVSELGGKDIDHELEFQLGWMLYQLQSLQHFALSYSAKDDREYVKTNPDKAAAMDKRIQHRLSLAMNIGKFAEWVGYGKLLTDDLAPVLTATQKGQKTSLLALFGDWEETPADMNAMERELPHGLIEGYEPLTGTDIINYSYGNYFEQLTIHLQSILKSRRYNYDKSQEPIVNEAIQKTKSSFKVPERWVLKNYIAAFRPEDEERIADLVGAHPRFLQRFKPELKKGKLPLVPQDLSKHLKADGIIVWVAPNMEALVALLKTIEPLNELVEMELGMMEEERKAAEAKKSGKKGEKKEEEDPEWVKWFNAMSKVIMLNPEYEEKVHGVITTAFGEKQTALAVELRRATSHERRYQLQNKISPTWAEYFPDKLKTMFKADEAVQFMIDFATHVSPPKDQPLQFSALILELAPLMMEKLGPQDVLLGLLATSGISRMDLILFLLPHLEGALAFAGDEANQKDLLSADMDIYLPKGFAVHYGELEKLVARMKSTQITSQMQFGLQGDAKENVLVPEGRGYPIKPGEDFVIDGVTYKLEKVHKSFTYYRKDLVSMGGVQWPASTLGDSIYLDETGTPIPKESRPGDLLFEIVVDEQKEKVTDQDDYMLSKVCHAAVMRAFVKQMEDLQYAIEVFEELLELGVSFIPGVGPVLMVARIITGVLSFIASPEYEELISTLGKDPDKVISQGVDAVKSWLDPDLLWDWLLFGVKLFPKLTLKMGNTAKQSKAMAMTKSERAKSRLGRLLAGIKSVGKKIVGSIKRLRQKYLYSMRDAQLFVLSRPTLAKIMRLVGKNFYRLTTLDKEDLSLAGFAEKTEKGLVGSTQEIYGKVTELIEQLNDLELPNEIIPLEEIVDLTLELVMDRMGGRYKLALKAIREGMQRFEPTRKLWDDMIAGIAGQLKDAGMDPNVIWRDVIKTELQPVVQETGKSLAEKVGSTLEEVPFLKGIGAPGAGSVELGFQEGDVPDDEEDVTVQPFMLEAPALSPGLPGRISAGKSLPAGLRLDAERRFGHDFSHVRLHSGADAGKLTAHTQAQALTSGSHIFMKPGLSPAAGFGRRVFYHEMAHVLQQTGGRPLGGRHSGQPVTGRWGRGLEYRPPLEQAADRAAESAGRGPAARPLEVGSLPGLNPQPTLNDVIEKFFTNMGETETLRERVEKISPVKETDIKESLDAQGKQALATFYTELKGAILALKKGTGKEGFEPPFHTAREEIIQYVEDNHLKKLETMMPALIKAGMQEKVSKDKTSGKTEIVYFFNPDRFQIELEEYIFGTSGVFFKIELRTEKAKPGQLAKKELSATAPVKSVYVKYLYLPYLGGTAKLWENLILNTFKNSSPKLFKTKYATLGADAKAAYQGQARLLLGALGPRPHVFVTKEVKGVKMLCFTDEVAKQIEEMVFPPAGAALPAADLPAAADYVKDEKSGGNFIPAKGYIALRFGRYEQSLKLGDAQYGPDRNSHHLTQYLLLEYFHNTKDQKPFIHSLPLYPGVAGGGKKVDSIQNGATSKILKIQEYEDGRGGKMPAILISKYTHVYGDVHIHAKPDDDGKSSPGAAVHGVFKDSLGEWKDVMFESSGAKLKSLDTSGTVMVGTATKTSLDLQNAIFSAACKTYTWMRDKMMGKLEDALKTKEVEYYNEVAGRAPQAQSGGAIKNEYVMEKSMMTSVIENAKKKNAEIMEAEAGFEEKK